MNQKGVLPFQDECASRCIQKLKKITRQSSYCWMICVEEANKWSEGKMNWVEIYGRVLEFTSDFLPAFFFAPRLDEFEIFEIKVCLFFIFMHAGTYTFDQMKRSKIVFLSTIHDKFPALPSKSFILWVVDNETSFFLQQLNSQGKSYNH